MHVYTQIEYDRNVGNNVEREYPPQAPKFSIGLLVEQVTDKV